MTETLFLADATEYTADQLARVVREQLSEPYKVSDNLRTAAMYCPKVMTPREWVAACVANNVKENTARNRLNEVRTWQKELGEI
jgi:uncharacterized protein YecA (UPF0149 family)